MTSGAAPRLLLVSTEFPPGPGGIGTHAYHLALQLRERGWEVAVFAAQDYADEARIRAFNQNQPFPIVRLEKVAGSPIRAVRRFRAAWEFARTWKPDLVVASGDRAASLAAWVARTRRLPWVAVGHGGEFCLASPAKRRLVRWAFNRADAVVTVSEYTRARMLGAGIRPRMDRVIPNGADEVRFTARPPEESAAFRSEHGLDGACILLTVGNVYERKGQDVVIRALPAVMERAPHVRYLVVGTPTRAEEFGRLAASLGVAEQVRFLGCVDPDTLVRCVNASDLFVMTSRHSADGDFEGYGIAVVEAALCGKPAVVSGNSGLAEAVVDGATALCVPENDVEATAGAILALVEDEALRHRMGEHAQRRARAEQTWSRRVAEYDRFFREILGTTRAERAGERAAVGRR